jgi:GDPmannose 4,6-dehydratase
MADDLIIGCKGQDGLILTGLLEGYGRVVAGVSKNNLYYKGKKTPFNVLNDTQVRSLIQDLKPKRVYYLAGYHHSAQQSPNTDPFIFKRSLKVHVDGLLGIIEALHELAPKSRMFYAASSHIFGLPESSPQTERSVINPISVYGITKYTGMKICQFFRNNLNYFCSVGILYNHESILRSTEFVSAKIVHTAVNIKLGLDSALILGDMEVEVDWGYAPDYMDAVIRILDAEKPNDFIISSGSLYKVKDFVEVVFDELDLDWKKYVKIDKEILLNENKRQSLFGDNSLLCSTTGWSPSTNMREMARIMVKNKIKEVEGL